MSPKYTSINPITASPVKPNPITAPDSNAMRNDFSNDILAAAAVRTLPFVAIFIPI